MFFFLRLQVANNNKKNNVVFMTKNSAEKRSLLNEFDHLKVRFLVLYSTYWLKLTNNENESVCTKAV